MSADSRIREMIDWPCLKRHFDVSEQLLHHKKFAIIPNGLLGSDIGIGTQDRQAIILGFFSDFTRIDFKGRPFAATT